MFGRLKDFWSARRQASEIPRDLDRIITARPEGWQMVSFKWNGDNWIVELSFQDRRFRVDTDYGYPWTAVELIDEEPPILTSPLNRRWSVRGNPDHIHAELAKIEPRKK